MNAYTETIFYKRTYRILGTINLIGELMNLTEFIVIKPEFSGELTLFFNAKNIKQYFNFKAQDKTYVCYYKFYMDIIALKLKSMGNIEFRD